MTNNDDNGFEFDDAEKFPERLLLKGRSQETIKEICEACGWKDELMDRKEKADASHDQKIAAAEKASPEVDDLAKQLGALDVNKDEEKPKEENEVEKASEEKEDKKDEEKND